VDEVINDFDFGMSINGVTLTSPGSPSGVFGLSLPSGGYEVLTLNVTPFGGFTDPVKFGCSSVPDHTQCVFSQQTTKPLSGGTQSVQFTINTSDVLGYGPKVAELQSPRTGKQSAAPLLATILWPLGMFCGLVGGFFRRSSKRLGRLLMLLAVVGLSLSLEACSGKLPGETPPGSYTIVLTGTDAGSQTTLTHSITINLTVTPH
jgi:hypothetical protein